MGLLIPDGFGQLALRWRLTGDPEEMIATVGYKYHEAVSTEAACQGLVDEWHAEVGSNALSTSYTFVGGNVIENRDGDLIGATHEVNEVGANADPCPSQQVAVLVHKRTAVGGTKGRGRMYLPAGYLGEADISPAGVIDPAWVAQLQAGVGLFRIGASDPAIVEDLYLLHSPISAGAGNAPFVLNDMHVDSLAASQRGRLRR